MRVLVLGIGKIGSALLGDLIQSRDITEIVASDIDLQRVRQYVRRLNWEDRVRPRYIDVLDHNKLVALMKDGFDVVANMMISDYNVRIAKAAVEAGVNMVDVGVIFPETFALEKAAKDAGVTIIPSCGLDPGLDRVLEGFAARRFDVVEGIYLWCGGFPQKNTPGYNNPLRYKVSWYWRRAIESYLGKVSILRDGQVVEVEKLSGPANPEIIVFPEPVGECEAFYTSAPFDTIEHLGLKSVRNAWNKTVRWKGHCEMWTKLIALGLTETEPLKVRQCEVAPIDFLVELGNKRFQYEEGEGDVVVERVQVEGLEDGKRTTREYQLVDFYDKKRDVTAMGRTTAYTCSIVSQMIGRGEVKQTGIVHPSKIGCDRELANRFFTELAKRDIHITERVTQPLA